MVHLFKSIYLKPWKGIQGKPALRAGANNLQCFCIFVNCNVKIVYFLKYSLKWSVDVAVLILTTIKLQWQTSIFSEILILLFEYNIYVFKQFVHLCLTLTPSGTGEMLLEKWEKHQSRALSSIYLHWEILSTLCWPRDGS